MAQGIGSVYNIYNNMTQVGNAAGVETTLNSFTIAAGVLAKNGDSIVFEYCGVLSGEVGSIVATIYDGSNTGTLCSASNIDPLNKAWVLSGRLVRTSATAQTSYSSFFTEGIQTNEVNSGSCDLSLPITLKITGTFTSLNDVYLNGVYLSFWAVPL